MGMIVGSGFAIKGAAFIKCARCGGCVGGGSSCERQGALEWGVGVDAAAASAPGAGRERAHLAERLFNKLEHAPIQILERVLQVADAAVDELGGAPRRARRKVVALHDSHLEPAGGSLPRHAGAHAAAANDEQVELLLLQAAADTGRWRRGGRGECTEWGPRCESRYD